MNLVRYRRNLIIIGGMIFMNIIMQLYVCFRGMDLVTVGSYFSVNMIWMDTIRRFCDPLVKSIDRRIEKGEF